MRFRIEVRHVTGFFRPKMNLVSETVMDLGTPVVFGVRLRQHIEAWVSKLSGWKISRIGLETPYYYFLRDYDRFLEDNTGLVLYDTGHKGNEMFLSPNRHPDKAILVVVDVDPVEPKPADKEGYRLLSSSDREREEKSKS